MGDPLVGVVHNRAGQPIDPRQLEIGLRPTQSQPVDHAIDQGPPESVGAGRLPAFLGPLTQVVMVAPLVTVAQVSNGVAIFGTGGGRAVTP